MINISYSCEELKNSLDTTIDKLLATDIYIYVSTGDNNLIYNAITDPQTGHSCYPDMLFKHNFTETAILDSNLYIIADAAIKRYGSSRCYFLALHDTNMLLDFIGILREVYGSTLPGLSHENIELIEKFSNDLMLSATMMHSFKTLMTYYAETGGDIPGLLTPFMEEYPMPVTTKQKGKQIYELIRNKILC